MPSNAIAGACELCPLQPLTGVSIAASAEIVGSSVAGNADSATSSPGTVIAMWSSCQVAWIGHSWPAASSQTAWL